MIASVVGGMKRRPEPLAVRLSFGRVRNAAGDGPRMPGDQAEEVRPREAKQSVNSIMMAMPVYNFRSLAAGETSGRANAAVVAMAPTILARGSWPNLFCSFIACVIQLMLRHPSNLPLA
jgi:hypothetical protein